MYYGNNNVIADDIYKPTAAYEKLKMAHAVNRPVYVMGSIGYGKTTVVREFLKNEKYLYITGKSGELFPLLTEEEIETQHTENIIVIDDISWLTDKKSRKLIISLIEKDKYFLIMIGRSKIPEWLKTTYYRKVFMVIEEQDLWLTQSDLEEIFRKNDIYFNQRELKVINDRIEGHPVAVQMLLLHLKNGEKYDDNMHEMILRDMFSYLEYELYQKWDEVVRNFVMEISIVDSFTILLAEMITGRNDVEAVINKILRIGNFMEEKDGEYIMKSIVRESMRNRLNIEYTKEQRNELYYNAGLYYEMKGKPKEALRMYELSGNVNRISKVLVKNAEKSLNTGHYFELRHYYYALPEEMIRKSITLMAGMSMLYSLTLQPKESERWYRLLRNYENKQPQGSLQRKKARSQRAYLDIALPHRGSKKTKEILISIATLIMNKSISLSEFSVTSNLPSVMNGGKDFCEWSPYDRTLAKTISKPVEYVLGKYGVGLTDIALGESLYEKGEDTNEVMMLLNRGRYKAENGGKLEMCFVAVGLLVRLNVIKGKMEEAHKLLEDFKNKVIVEGEEHLMSNIRTLECRLALYDGNKGVINEWLEKSPSEDVEFFIFDRYKYLTKIRVYILYGRWDEAISLSQRLLHYARNYDRTYISMETELLLAICQYKMKDSKWKETLHSVLKKTYNYRFVNIIVEEGSAVFEMIQNCRYKDIPSAYLKKIRNGILLMKNHYSEYLRGESDKEVRLSEQAVHILLLQSEGKTAKQIAEDMCISEATVRFHNKNIYRTLGVTGKAEAIKVAKEMRII